MNSKITFRANETERHSLHYSFTVVTQDWLTFVYNGQVLQQLFSVFFLDVQNFMELASNSHQVPQRMEELFIFFLRLVSEYFIKHNDMNPRVFRKVK